MESSSSDVQSASTAVAIAILADISKIKDSKIVKYLFAVKGAARGQCNICGESAPLTNDHTPPKGCSKPGQVEIRSIIEHLSSDPDRFKGRNSQNGAKYRTLCARCNNGLLGANYDPPFISFVNALGTTLRSSLVLPAQINIRGQPQAIARSLLGHLCAVGVDRYQKGALTEPIRDFLLDHTSTLPDELFVYYWAYPFKPLILVRDAAYLDVPTEGIYSFWLLKFFPIAFMVAWNRPTVLDPSIGSFEQWRNVPYETEVEIPVTLRPLPWMHWPEAPTDRSVVTYGRDAVYVIPGRSEQ